MSVGRCVRRLGCCILLLGLGSAVPGLGQDEEEQRARAQLAQLKEDMTQLSAELKSDLARRSALRDALRRSEEAIGRIQRDINVNLKKLERSQAQLADLREQRQELLVARGQQQELITREIQTAYQMGKQAQVRVLLNQEDPSTLARAMTYYDYFYQARQEHIDRYLEILERIDILEPEISEVQASLKDTRKTLDGKREELLTNQQRRQVDLNKVNAGIKSKDQQLQAMGRDREELERLLEVIEQAVAEMEVPEAYQPFNNAQGAMPWPVSGKPRNRFGGRRGQGPMRWQGLVIPATEGSNVIAIHHGRVVFADWFRGSGLLLIIDLARVS